MDTKNSNSNDAKFVSFVTDSDEGCIPSGHGDAPGIVIHPDARPVNLWGIAESRLISLDKMLAMFEASGGGSFTTAEFAEVVRPRMQEILTLAITGNGRASIARITSRAIRRSM